MKSILMSIKPKYVSLIKSGEKILEVRKKKPIIEYPFQVYVYQTKPRGDWNEYDGHVVLEFTCDFITDSILPAEKHLVEFSDCRDSCLTPSEIIKYAAGSMVYFWHIKDVIIYDKPRELSEFWCNKVLQHPPVSWCYVVEMMKEAEK